MSDGSANEGLQFESSEEEAPAPAEPPVVLDNVTKANAYLQPEMFIAQRYPDKKVIEPPEGAFCGFCGMYLSDNMTLPFKCANCGMQGRGTTDADTFITEQIGLPPVRRTPPL